MQSPKRRKFQEDHFSGEEEVNLQDIVIQHTQDEKSSPLKKNEKKQKHKPSNKRKEVKRKKEERELKHAKGLSIF